MSVDAAYAGRLRQLSEMPQARPPATLGEVWQAEWSASGLDTFDGVGQPMLEARRELLERLESVTGKSLAELSRETGIRLVGPGGERAASDAFTALAAKLPEDQRKQIEPFADIVGNARTKAREIEKQAEDVGAATYGLSGYATSFAAGISRQMVSPVNIALMPLGGPLTGSVPRMLAREAGFGMLGQAVQEPFIAAGREQLGLQGSSFENIIQAGIGQAAFAGVFRAGAAGLRVFNESRALSAEGLTRETAPLARALEQDLANPFATRPPTDEAGRLVMDAPRLDLPDGVRIPPQAARSAVGDNLPQAARSAVGDNPPQAGQGPIGDNAQGPARFGAELNATATGVEFGRFEQSPQLRDVATRLEPEDLDAIALLEERNAVLDAQARELVPAPRVPKPAVRRPVSMAEFIGRNGGLQLDADAKALGLDRMFIPRGGPLARRSGRSLDWWTNALTEEGYLDLAPDGYARADIDVYDEIRNALRDEATLKRRRYRRADEEAAGQFYADSRLEAGNARWEAEIAAREDDVRRALSSFDDDLSAIDPRDISRAAEMLANGDLEDAIAAFDRAALERMLADPEIAPIVTPVYRESVPGFDDADFSRSTRESGTGLDDGSFPGDRPSQEAASGTGGSNDTPSGQGGRPQSLEEAALLSGQAIDEAAAAMERGRVAPQPLAFRPTSVSASAEAFTVERGLDLAARNRPDLADALTAGPDGPLARAYFADDAMTIRLPDDVVQDRLSRAADRATSAELMGGERWPVAAIARLAQVIDTPVSELPAPKQAVPRNPDDPAVRVRTKAEGGGAASRAQAAEGGSARSPAQAAEGGSALSLKDKLRIQSVERQLAEIGDAPVFVEGQPTATSARAELARLADNDNALAELDACTRAGGDRSSSPTGGSGDVTS
jgi:hypothetical protein